MKRYTSTVNVLANIKEDVPYSRELAEAADVITDTAVEDSNSGVICPIEAAGRVSLATLLRATAEGKIPFKQAFPLLKGIAEKKTPDPVQRIEAHQTIDMRALVVSAVKENPQALENAVKIALTAREQVKQRIGAIDDKLELQIPISGKPISTPAHPTQSFPDNASSMNEPQNGLESYSLPKTQWTPGQSPSELEELNK